MAAATFGCRIHLNSGRPAADLVLGFQGVPTGNVCDAMDRMSAMDYRIKPLAPDSVLAGPALTVRTRPGDNLMVWKAIDVAQPGDVLVIATYEFLTASTFGERVVAAAKAKGLAGIVCDPRQKHHDRAVLHDDVKRPWACPPLSLARCPPAPARMARVRLAGRLRAAASRCTPAT